MSAQDTVIQFDDLPAGTIVSDQYQSQGVVFFTPSGGGILPVIVQVPAGEAHSGNQVASISTCEDCEFPVPFIRGRFTNTAEHISIFVGQFDGMPASAQLTLTAFDAGGTILAQSPPVMVTTGGGFNARISVEVPAATIASFEISGRAGPDSGKQVGIDDLTFGRIQDAPPDFSLLPAQTVLEVAQGASTNDTIALARFNGSTGPIQCTVSGLPSGVTADFQPDPVSSESTLLTLSADINAPLTGSAFAPVTITATPLSPDAGSGARTTQVSVAVRADFTLAVDGSDQVYLAACGTTSITLRVIRAIAFQSVEIGLSVVGLPPGVQATLTPSSVGAPPDGGLVNVVTLSLAVVDQQVPDTDITIQAAIKGAVATLVLHLLLSFASFAPTEGETPQSFHPGTTVTILGAGFTPDSVVVFGQDTVPSPTTGEPVYLGTATPSFIRPDGRELRVNVPYLATTGEIRVLTPQGNAYASCGDFTVHSYRNTNGFQLSNDFMTSVSFQDIADLYGHDQTHLTCTIFGLTVDVANPFARLYAALVDTALKGHRRCMGMALTAERFLHGDLSLSDFSAPPVTSIWQLQEIAHLTRSIHLQDIIQFSAEYMNAYLAQFVSHSLPTTSSDIRSLVRQLLQTGDHPLVNLRQEITHFEGHVMNAYDLEQGPLGVDDFFLRVYDPNAPFQKVEDTDGPEHQKKEEGSRVHVTPDGRWQFPNQITNNGVPWEGGFESLLILPYSAAPVHPTIPTSLDGLSKIIFGDGSQTIQLADTQGRTLFQADGSLNTDPATRLPQATPFPVLDSTSSDEDIYLCGGNGPFVQTLHALQTGGYSVTLLHSGLALRVEADATNLSLPDEITLDPQASHLGFHTGEARKALRAQLLAAAPDGDVRSAIVATSSFQAGTSSFSFDPARQTLTYQHSGPATECIITLEGTTRQSQRATFVSPPLHMKHGDRASVSPDDWHRLRRTTVTLTVTHQDGTQSVRKLKNHKPDADPNEDDTDTPPHRERE